MSNFDYENFPEGEWDDRGDLVWNEFDWERYIRSQDDSLKRYQELYAELKSENDRLDRIAQQMGWDIEDWTGCDGETEDDDQEIDDDELGDDHDLFDEPYTLQRHPVYISSKALYIWLQSRLIELCCRHRSLPAGMATQFQATLHMGESNCMAGIHALDMGDYALAVCFFKRMAADLNRSLRFLDILARACPVETNPYRGEAILRLFDLREIALRVMHYSREELDRGIRDDE